MVVKQTGFHVMILLAVILVLAFWGCSDFNLFDILDNALSVVPAEAVLHTGEELTFSAASGVSPFSFVITNGGGSIGLSSGDFKAPDTPADVSIALEDSAARSASATVYVVDSFTIDPPIVTLPEGALPFTFTANGGRPPYTFTNENTSVGSWIDAVNGIYSADTAGEDVVVVEDSVGNVVKAAVTVIPAGVFMLNPQQTEILVNSETTFKPVNLVGSVAYVLDPPAFGSLAPLGVNVTYTAPGIEGVATITATDDMGTVGDLTDDITTQAVVYVVAELLAISPSGTITLYVGNTFTFAVSGGKAPYEFSLTSGIPGSATIESDTGLFTALLKDANVFVTVTDANGNTDSCRVKVK
jgi:hypothetical protein